MSQVVSHKNKLFNVCFWYTDSVMFRSKKTWACQKRSTRNNFQYKKLFKTSRPAPGVTRSFACMQHSLNLVVFRPRGQGIPARNLYWTLNVGNKKHVWRTYGEITRMLIRWYCVDGEDYWKSVRAIRLLD